MPEPTYRRPDADLLVCPECDARFSMPADWLDAHDGEHIACPRCALSSKIPTIEAEPDETG